MSIFFTPNLFSMRWSDGWDENNADEHARYIINKLQDNEKEMLAKNIILDEISKVIKIL